MIYLEFKNNIFYIVLISIFVKSMAFGFTLIDCFAALVLLSFALADKCFNHLFPKRPDLYADLNDIRTTLDAVQSKTDELGRDVLLIKMGGK